VSTGMVAKSDAASRRPLPVKKRVQRRWISRNSSALEAHSGIVVAPGCRCTSTLSSAGSGTYVTILTVIFALLARSGIGLNARSGWRRLRLFADLSFDQLGIDIEMAEVRRTPAQGETGLVRASRVPRHSIAVPAGRGHRVMTLNDFGTLDSATPHAPTSDRGVLGRRTTITEMVAQGSSHLVLRSPIRASASRRTSDA